MIKSNFENKFFNKNVFKSYNYNNNNNNNNNHLKNNIDIKEEKLEQYKKNKIIKFYNVLKLIFLKNFGSE